MRAAGGGPGGPAGSGRAPGGITEADRENAKLPLPPEEDSQLDVLLRPGLLADVEIIIDKIPDAISIPNQALFERDGRQYVYVQNVTGQRFEERTIKLAKRSESVMVIAEGLKPGEVIALGDPTARKKDNKNEKAASKSIMPAAAGGKGK
jgi:HlyD family secretion protein